MSTVTTITYSKNQAVRMYVQVGRMGCDPACGRSSNSRNVSYSQPILHRQGAPSGRGDI